MTSLAGPSLSLITIRIVTKVGGGEQHVKMRTRVATAAAVAMMRPGVRG
jgi:hypothetical protein